MVRGSVCFAPRIASEIAEAACNWKYPRSEPLTTELSEESYIGQLIRSPAQALLTLLIFPGQRNPYSWLTWNPKSGSPGSCANGVKGMYPPWGNFCGTIPAMAWPVTCWVRAVPTAGRNARFTLGVAVTRT